MNAIKCDRCGEICHPDEISEIEYIDGNSIITRTFTEYIDLCPKCNSEFKQWKAKI